MRLKARILHWWRTYWSLGRRGERAAARLLRSQGYRVLARNARVPMGEADLVCLAPDGKTVVIVEVKTRIVRDGFDAVPPEANITAHKRRKLASIARHLVRTNGWETREVRIDVVAVEWRTDAARRCVTTRRCAELDSRALGRRAGERAISRSSPHHSRQPFTTARANPS